MIISSDAAEKRAALDVANLMCAAARTAPKARGWDNILTKILTDEDIVKVSDKMAEIAVGNLSWITRDAGNIRNCQAIVLIGVKRARYELNCGYCGYTDCGKCSEGTGTCVFAYTDLGIALGSAVACAADHRIDTRIMYSIGRAIAVMPEYNDGANATWLGIPLSVTGKSPYFDRK